MIKCGTERLFNIDPFGSGLVCTRFEALLPSACAMQIFVKRWSGKTITLDVQACTTIGGVEAKILHQDGVQPEDQRLLYVGTLLEDRLMLAGCNINNEATLLLNWPRPRGGGGGGDGGGGGGGDGSWARHVKQRVGPWNVHPPPPVRSPHVPNGEQVSQQKVQMMYPYSWHALSHNWTWQCSACTAEWHVSQ